MPEVELSKGLKAKLSGGKLAVEYDLAVEVFPKIDEFKSKILSKEVDLIPGTDWEVGPAVAALEMIKAELMK